MTVKKLSIIWALFILFFIPSALSAQTLSERFTDRNSGISMNYPEGWTQVEIGLKYQAIIAPADNNFTPNFTFMDMEYEGSAGEYIDELTTELSRMYTSLRIVQKGDFSTASGLQGMYAVLTGQMNQIAVWQKVFVIRHSRRQEYMMITCSAAVNQGSKYESIFDECVKTFQW